FFYRCASICFTFRVFLTLQSLYISWFIFFFSSRRRHTRFSRDWSSDVCSSDLSGGAGFSATGLLPAAADRSRSLRLILPFVTPYRVSYNPKRQASWFGLIPFRSPLLRESHLLSLPPGT